jgi:hypothetical protein
LSRPAPTGRPAGSTTAAPTPPREWLLAAAVPFLICLGALAWIVLHPEIQGDTQLGLAALTYAAALFGVRKWMRATTAAAAQRQSDAA